MASPSADPSPVDPTSTLAPPTVVESTPTVEGSSVDCSRWETVDKSRKGQETCVYGNVFIAYSVDDADGNTLWWIVRFSEEPTAFYFTQDEFAFEFQLGDCLSVTGPLQLDDNGTAFVENGELSTC